MNEYTFDREYWLALAKVVLSNTLGKHIEGTWTAIISKEIQFVVFCLQDKVHIHVSVENSTVKMFDNGKEVKL